MTRARLRVPHPVVALRRLRAGVLGTVAVTALLYLVVADRAGEQIAAADRTGAAVRHIREAYDQAGKANDALDAVSGIGAIGLTGTGDDFANATARVRSHLTSATEGNAAGERGLSHIQFVQGQLATCVQLANTAVLDGAPGVARARDALDDAPEYEGSRPVPFTGGLRQSLRDLALLEDRARKDQLRSGWRDPGLLWPLFTGPLVVMLLLVGVTGRIVVRRFRRYPSPALGVAVLATAAVGVAMCTTAPPAAAIALPVLAAAGALAYLAYRPRLAEYRFPRP
ncbi:hypothetical protein [Streptomyces asoensis]|uniref:Integral membrane protein n=1 Tax=Streptomyces asoensis TaxID=249586 RepID=A0ABQ3RXB6_9ACTN|nr:hypothetical protein [Streptomyces asoensis]GGQ52965.1 hypothetical protein GCM10010496_14160 [Streptomyces asoensis]GHI60507.1 hypothetical protein Saso_21570 [Streptomyces asoensis]